jgi:hypothetical protein
VTSQAEADSWQNDANVYHVEDSKGRKMWYRLDFAKENPENAPIMLALHGVGHVARPSYYAEKHWNTIKPLDQFGFENKGSWWFGEYGEPFTAKLLYKVVYESRKKLNSDPMSKLFIYGSSMGGYGALLHGARLGATAVYANVPQVKLLGSTYSNNGMKRHFDVVMEPKNGTAYWLLGHVKGLYRMNDLSEYLESIEDVHPLYFICENRFGSTDNYLNEHTLKLVDMFMKNDIKYHLEIIPTKGHNKNRGIREVREMFEKYCLNND